MGRGEGIRSLGRGDSRKRPKEVSVRCGRDPVGRARKRGTLEDVELALGVNELQR